MKVINLLECMSNMNQEITIKIRRCDLFGDNSFTCKTLTVDEWLVRNDSYDYKFKPFLFLGVESVEIINEEVVILLENIKLYDRAYTS